MFQNTDHDEQEHDHNIVLFRIRFFRVLLSMHMYCCPSIYFAWPWGIPLKWHAICILSIHHFFLEGDRKTSNMAIMKMSCILIAHTLVTHVTQYRSAWPKPHNEKSWQDVRNCFISQKTQSSLKVTWPRILSVFHHKMATCLTSGQLLRTPFSW